MKYRDKRNMVDVVMNVYISFVFLYKQKTAYDIRLSFVGSEMCIRDGCMNKQGSSGLILVFVHIHTIMCTCNSSESGAEGAAKSDDG